MNVEPPEALVPRVADLLYNTTATLVRLPFNKTRDRGSGVMFRKGDHLHLLSAGHILCGGKAWAIEPCRVYSANDGRKLYPLNSEAEASNLRVPYTERKIPVVPILSSRLLPSGEALYDKTKHVDLAHSVMSLAALDAATPEGFSLEFPISERGIAAPDRGSEYLFAAWTLDEPDGNLRVDLRTAIWECRMTFAGLDEDAGRHVFALSSKHQGDEVYEGASGAPIVDPNGTVVSLLIGGDKESNELWGAPLVGNLPPELEIYGRSS